MSEERPSREVHVYGDGRGFVVVPVIARVPGEVVEITPVQRVWLTLGRSTSYELSRALARALSRGVEAPENAARWDGDRGRWWEHHLLSVVIRWEQDGVLLMFRQRRADGTWESVDRRSFPPDTTTGALAEEIIHYLGRCLHGG